MPFEIEQEYFGGEVKVIRNKIFGDHRGYFMEVYRQDQFAALGVTDEVFLQDNQSRSTRGVIRGLHFQYNKPMSKLMRVVRGKAKLIAVDIRKGSPTLGEWVAIEASDEDHLQLWAPYYFARGFCALSDVTEIQYKCTAVYNPQGEGGIRWNDPEIGIDWAFDNPLLSPKDEQAPTLAEWLQTPAADLFAYQPNT